MPHQSNQVAVEVPAIETEMPVEPSLRQSNPVLWAGTLFGPIALTGGILAVLWVLYGGAYMWKLGVAILITFFGLGRFVIVLGASHDSAAMPEALRQFSAEKLFFVVLYMDVMAATILSCHTSVLFKIPVFGRKVKALVQDGSFILKSHPWMKRATFIGIVAFVMFPLAATGSVGGSLFGRLLGMSRIMTFIGVVFGSLLGCGVMYLFAELINKHLPRDNPITIIGGILFVVAFIVWLNLRYKKMKRRMEAGE